MIHCMWLVKGREGEREELSCGTTSDSFAHFYTRPQALHPQLSLTESSHTGAGL